MIEASFYFIRFRLFGSNKAMIEKFVGLFGIGIAVCNYIAFHKSVWHILMKVIILITWSSQIILNDNLGWLTVTRNSNTLIFSAVFIHWKYGKYINAQITRKSLFKMIVTYQSINVLRWLNQTAIELHLEMIIYWFSLTWLERKTNN